MIWNAQKAIRRIELADKRAKQRELSADEETELADLTEDLLQFYDPAMRDAFSMDVNTSATE